VESWWVHSTNACGHCRYRGDPDSGGLAGWTYRVARYIRQWQSVSASKMAREQHCIPLPSVRLRIRDFSVHRLRQPSSPGQEVSEVPTVWQEELGEGAYEEGRAKRLFHPFHEGGLAFVAVDGAGHPELLHYWLLSRPDWPGRLASGRAASELLS